MRLAAYTGAEGSTVMLRREAAPSRPCVCDQWSSIVLPVCARSACSSRHNIFVISITDTYTNAYFHGPA